MQSIILDTNVVVSALISKNSPPCLILSPPTFACTTIADEEDNRFLELALVAQSDFLITGNTNDFTMKTVGRTQIVTPREYCDLHWPGRG